MRFFFGPCHPLDDHVPLCVHVSGGNRGKIGGMLLLECYYGNFKSVKHQQRLRIFANDLLHDVSCKYAKVIHSYNRFTRLPI